MCQGWLPELINLGSTPHGQPRLAPAWNVTSEATISPAERKFWLAANRRASLAEPEIAQAILRAFAILKDSLTETELARFIDSGNFDALIRHALNDQTLDRAFIPLRQRIRQTVESNVNYFARSTPGGGRINGSIAIEFNVMNPRVIEALDTLNTKVVQSLGEDTREGLLTAVRQGLIDGKTPREIAKRVQPFIGISPKQEQNAVKFAAREVAKGKTPEQVERAVAIYRKRAVAFNATTNARTASLDAMKEGQRQAWVDAKAKGVVPEGAQLTKTWRGVMDARERPEHVAMEGQTVPFDMPYSNGEFTPGDSTYNCRCISIVRVA